MESRGMMYVALYFIVLVALYYVCMVIPGRRRKREHELMQSSVQKGDQIVTVGGISEQLSKPILRF
ncbi:MAG: preprotein translocase subunit YajC [Pyramidobacter sp.]|nr:preprotein translocase subunit YajC [Pyramidobacter sp.]